VSEGCELQFAAGDSVCFRAQQGAFSERLRIHHKAQRH
jgi:hypothetical protein